MDWFSWLSRTNLKPSLIHEYALCFSHNELEHEDIAFFNHEFLQSMGISIAKHRLEILKLARRNHSPFSIFRFVFAIRKTGKCFSDHLRTWIRGEESSQALVLVPKRSVIPSNRDGGFDKEERLLLTNGTPCRDDSFSSPMVFDYNFNDDKLYSHRKDLEIVNWDSMFHNLKPT